MEMIEVSHLEGKEESPPKVEANVEMQSKPVEKVQQSELKVVMKT